MEQDSKNESLNAAHIKSLLLTIASCVFAPLLSHWLNVFLGPSINPWSSERLLILFFSALTGEVICDKFRRLFKKSKLYLMGFDLDQLGVLHSIWIFPSSIVVLFYDTIFGATSILIMVIIASIILWKDKDEIEFTDVTYISIGGYCLIMIIAQFLDPFETTAESWIKAVVISFLTQLVGASCGAFLEYTLRMRKMKKLSAILSELDIEEGTVQIIEFENQKDLLKKARKYVDEQSLRKSDDSSKKTL